MKTYLVASLVLFASGAYAQYHDLPYCEVDGYSQECRNSNSTQRETKYVPGCSITCPATKSPLCRAGTIPRDCDASMTMPVCKCE